MTRLHPFDVVFGTVAAQWFPPIRAEAARAKLPGPDLARFARLPPVEKLLAQFRPETVNEANAEAGEEYLRLLYAGYRYWEDGQRTIGLERDQLEQRLASLANLAPLTPPTSSAYLRLPEHWIWGQVKDGSPHEPLDGLFVISGHRARDLLVAAVLGLRPERDGFSQITVTAMPDDLRGVSRAARRPPLEPAMDGGRAAGFHSVTSVAELLLLAHLALVSAGE